MSEEKKQPTLFFKPRPPMGETESIFRDLSIEMEAKTGIKIDSSERHSKLRNMVLHALDDAWFKGYEKGVSKKN